MVMEVLAGVYNQQTFTESTTYGIGRVQRAAEIVAQTQRLFMNVPKIRQKLPLCKQSFHGGEACGDCSKK
jgi:PhoPQ-activated pathogenicity-related protein